MEEEVTSLWLQSGDKNTANFHKQAQFRRQFNSVKGITVQDSTIANFANIKRETFQHFKRIYNEDTIEGTLSSLIDHVPNKIIDQMNLRLNKPVS